MVLHYATGKPGRRRICTGSQETCLSEYARPFEERRLGIMERINSS